MSSSPQGYAPHTLAPTRQTFLPSIEEARKADAGRYHLAPLGCIEIDPSFDLARRFRSLPLFLIEGDKSTDPVPAPTTPSATRSHPCSAEKLRVQDAMNLLAEHESQLAVVAAQREDFAAYHEHLKKERLWRKRARDIRDCGTQYASVPLFACTNCDEEWSGHPLSCGKRFCPDCCERERARTVAVIQELVAGFRHPRFLTLTIRSRPPGCLKAMVRDLASFWEKLRRRVFWTRRVDAAIAVFEETFNAKAGWHPHIHVICDGRFLPRDEIVSLWETITKGEGTGAGVDIRDCGGDAAKAASYVAKYVGKGLGSGQVLEDDRELLAEVIEAFWRFRTMRTYGTAFGMHKKRSGMPPACPECKSPGEFVGLISVAQAELRGLLPKDPERAHEGGVNMPSVRGPAPLPPPVSGFAGIGLQRNIDLEKTLPLTCPPGSKNPMTSLDSESSEAKDDPNPTFTFTNSESQWSNMKYKLTRAETETHIYTSAIDSEWTIDTEDKTRIRKLTKLFGPGEPYGAHGYTWKVTLACISFRRPIKLSPEEKKIRGERLQRSLKRRKASPSSME